jgi:hypothetical protein
MLNIQIAILSILASSVLSEGKTYEVKNDFVTTNRLLIERCHVTNFRPVYEVRLGDYLDSLRIPFDRFSQSSNKFIQIFFFGITIKDEITNFSINTNQLIYNIFTSSTFFDGDVDLTSRTYTVDFSDNISSWLTYSEKASVTIILNSDDVTVAFSVDMNPKTSFLTKISTNFNSTASFDVNSMIIDAEHNCGDLPKDTQLVFVSPLYSNDPSKIKAQHLFSQFDEKNCNIKFFADNKELRPVNCTLNQSELIVSGLFENSQVDTTKIKIVLSGITNPPPFILNQKLFQLKMRTNESDFMIAQIALETFSPIDIIVSKQSMASPFKNTIGSANFEIKATKKSIICDPFTLRFKSKSFDAYVANSTFIVSFGSQSISHSFTNLNGTSELKIVPGCFDLNAGVAIELRDFTNPPQIGSLNLNFQLFLSGSNELITKKFEVNYMIIEKLSQAWSFEPVSKALGVKTDAMIKMFIPLLSANPFIANIHIQIDPLFRINADYKLEPISEFNFYGSKLVIETNELIISGVKFDSSTVGGYFFELMINNIDNQATKYQKIESKLLVKNVNDTILWDGSYIFDGNPIDFRVTSKIITPSSDRSFKINLGFVIDTKVDFPHDFHIQLPISLNFGDEAGVAVKTNIASSAVNFKYNSTDSYHLSRSNFLLNATPRLMNFIEIFGNTTSDSISSNEKIQIWVTYQNKTNNNSAFLSTKQDIGLEVYQCPGGCLQCLIGQSFPLLCGACITIDLELTEGNKGCQIRIPKSATNSTDANNATKNNSSNSNNNRLVSYLQMSPSQITEKLYMSIHLNTLIIGFVSAGILKLFYRGEFLAISFLACVLSFGYSILIFVIMTYIFFLDSLNGLLINIPNFVFIACNVIFSVAIAMKSRGGNGLVGFKLMSIQSNSLFLYIFYALFGWGCCLWMIIFGSPIIYQDTTSSFGGLKTFKQFIEKITIAVLTLLAINAVSLIGIIFSLQSISFTLKLAHTIFATILIVVYLILYLIRRGNRIGNNQSNFMTLFSIGELEKANKPQIPGEFISDFSPPDKYDESYMELTEGEDYQPIRNVFKRMKTIASESHI